MKPIAILVICALLMGILFILDIALGSVVIPIKEVFKAIAGVKTEKESWSLIVLQFRIPKAITAVLAGSGLSVAGLLLQTFFRNPLAGPYVLGISSGAGLGVALTILSGFSLGGSITRNFVYLGSWGQFFSAFLGALGVLLIVLVVSIRVKNNVTLLIVGLMVGQTASALVSLLQYGGTPEQIQAYVNWTFGSLGGVDWPQLKIMTLFVGAGIGVAFLSQKSLNSLLLGHQQAQALGISISRVQAIILISTSLMSGAINAFCGPIAFLGMAVPHITRSLLNTSDHKLLIPGVVLIGAMITVLCDILSQLPGESRTLPLNSITALFGAPVVVWLILKNKSLKRAFS